MKEALQNGRKRAGIVATALMVLLVGVIALAQQSGESEPAVADSDPAPAAEAAPEPDASAVGGAAPPAMTVASSSADMPVGRVGDGAGGLSAAYDGASAADDVAVPAGPLPPLGEDVFPSVAAPRVPKPAAVRGLYVNAWAAGSRRKMAKLIALADSTEINSFVIDVKDATGYVSYPTGVALARQIGADRDTRIRDIRGLLAELRAHGIYPIARIVVFKDPLLAKRKPEWAIQKDSGGIWVDHNGELWVDSFNREVWDYAIALAREAVLLGFSEVQWDYVRFPDVPQRFMRTAVYPARAGRTREDAIREFLRYSRDRLSDLGVLITADVFGLTVSANTDMGIGQRWEKMVDVTDVLLPMVYPSHFAKGSYGIPVPNADPYQTVKTAMDFAVARSAGVAGAAAIRPWLQDFTLGWPDYGAAEVRAQIKATYDAGIDEWVLWNPASDYTAAALAPEGGEPPDLPIPVHRPRITIRDPQPEPLPLLGVPVETVKPIAPRDSTGGR
ncbi:MAG TPA: putative glycoside hydrolase [Longimicrobiales bacterium]